jgi:hypothetical protein
MNSTCTAIERPPLCELTAGELAAVSGGTMMDIVIRAAEAYLNATKDCLFRLTREGTVIDCSPGYKRPY